HQQVIQPRRALRGAEAILARLQRAVIPPRPLRLNSRHRARSSWLPRFSFRCCCMRAYLSRASSICCEMSTGGLLGSVAGAPGAARSTAGMLTWTAGTAAGAVGNFGIAENGL